MRQRPHIKRSDAKIENPLVDNELPQITYITFEDKKNLLFEVGPGCLEERYEPGPLDRRFVCKIMTPTLKAETRISLTAYPSNDLGGG